MKTFDFDSSVLSDNTENPQKRIASQEEIQYLAKLAAFNPYSEDYEFLYGLICGSTLDGYHLIRDEAKSAYLEAIKHVPDPLFKNLRKPFQTHINYVKDMCVLTGLEESEILDILPKSSSTIKFLSDVSEISGFSIQDVFDVLPKVTFSLDNGKTVKVVEADIKTLNIYAPVIAERVMDAPILDNFIEEVHKRTGCTGNEINTLLKSFTIKYDGKQVHLMNVSAKNLHRYLDDACSYIMSKTEDNPFSKSLLKTYNSNAIDALVYTNTTASARKWEQDPKKLSIVYHGTKYTFDNLYKELGTSSIKLLDASTAMLARNNFSLAGNNTSDEIFMSVKDYLRAQDLKVEPDYTLTGDALKKDITRANELVKALTKKLKVCCAVLSTIQISWDDVDDFGVINIFSKTQIKKGNIIITFSKDVASLFRNNPLITNYPSCLLKLDSKKKNAYCIGRKIAQHTWQRNNIIKGTNNTLSVKKLLDAAPEIPEYYETMDRGDWKRRIFDRFEDSMKDLINIHLLTRWEYRNPANGAVVPCTTARTLNYSSFEKLMVDYVVANENEQNIIV